MYQRPYLDGSKASTFHRLILFGGMRWVFGIIVITSLWLYGIWLMWTDGRTKAPSFEIFKRHVLYVFKFQKLRSSGKSLWSDTKNAVKHTFKPGSSSHKKAPSHQKSAEKKIEESKKKEQQKLHGATEGQIHVGGK